MFLLENPTRSYEWGSRTAIAALLGRAAPANPQAELWIGAHPDSPSHIVGGATDLLSRLRDDPRGLLGERTYDRFGDRLPYLLKVLAVERPLSLQVHPDRRHAVAGFDAECEDPASVRMFKDPHDKPELLYAVSEFHALCGLRSVAESRRLFERLSRDVSDVPTFAQIAHLLDDPGEAALNKAGAHIARLAPDEVTAAVGRLNATEADSADRPLRVAAELAAAYPDHPAVLLTLLLRHVTLRPGEALAVEPGTPHTHLSGVAVELTTCSDNTIRAGLTNKHVDIERFIDVVDFRPLHGAPVRASERLPGERILTTGHPEFELSVLRPSSGTTVRWDPKPRAVLVLDGWIELSSASGTVGLRRGESVFVPADAGVVEVRGDGHAVGATTA